jgi:hypothetical protein
MEIRRQIEIKILPHQGIGEIENIRRIEDLTVDLSGVKPFLNVKYAGFVKEVQKSTLKMRMASAGLRLNGERLSPVG